MCMTGKALSAMNEHRPASENLELSNSDMSHQLGFVLYNKARLILQQGDTAGAAGLLAEAIKVDPKNAPAYITMGDILRDSGQDERAAAMYSFGLSIDPAHGRSWHAMGLCLGQVDRVAEAEAAFRNARIYAPDFAPAYADHGVALFKLGRLNDAETALMQACRLAPRDQSLMERLAAVQLDLGKVQQACETAQATIAQWPEAPAAHYHLGRALEAMGQLQASVDAFRKAITFGYPPIPARLNLCAVLAKLGEPTAALGDMDAVLGDDPRNAVALFNKANLLVDLGREEEAERAFRRAIEIDPNYADALNNLGKLAEMREEWETAAELYNRALSIRPDDALLVNNTAQACKKVGDMAGAEARFRKACELDPNSPTFEASLGSILLLQGKYEEGLEHYEARRRMSAFDNPHHPFPYWEGESLAGKRVLVWCEQGYGDSLQCLRYVPLLEKRGAQVLVSCPPRLKRLVDGVVGVDEALVPPFEKLPQADYQIPMMSLPRLFGTRLDTVPADVPYITAPPRIQAFNLDHLSGVKVGLVWAGNPGHSNDLNRSIGLAPLMPVLNVPGIHFFGLQVGAAKQQIEDLGLKDRVTDWSPSLGGFADTAAAIQELDLVISVDTAVAHLTGALGKPLWLLLPYVPDFRWLMEGDRSPWYPSARLYRQPSRGTWGPVIDQLVADIAALR